MNNPSPLWLTLLSVASLTCGGRDAADTSGPAATAPAFDPQPGVFTDDITVTLDIPAERKPESTTLTVQVTPSLAVTMLDALPYLERDEHRPSRTALPPLRRARAPGRRGRRQDPR